MTSEKFAAQAGHLLTTDEFPFGVDYERGVVTFVGTEMGKLNLRSTTLRGCVMSPYILQWVEEEGPGLTASTLANVLLGLRTFVDFMALQDVRNPSSQSFSEYLKWLKNRPKERGGAGVLAEGTRRNYAAAVRDFLCWLPSEGVLDAGEVLEIKGRFTSAFRGSRERTRRRVHDLADALSSEEIARLYNAIRMEMECVERMLDEGDEHEIAGYDPVLPLLPFPLLVGVLLAGRSGEHNALQVRDLEDVPEHIRMHAPNKRVAYVYAVTEVRRAWQLAVRWQSRYRKSFEPDDPALLYLSRDPRRDRVIQLDSARMDTHIQKFYRKYFGMSGPDGSPVLHAIDRASGELVPFRLRYSNYRHASITEYQRYEKNPEKLRVFARHENLSTTLEFYVRNTHEEIRETMVSTLGPFSERVRMRVLARVGQGEEIRKAEARGDLRPGGACGEDIEGVRGCRRADDCRLCPHFLIDTRLRDWYKQDANRLREWAADLERSSGTLRDVQNLLGIASLNEAIVQIIDEHEAGFR